MKKFAPFSPLNNTTSHLSPPIIITPEKIKTTSSMNSKRRSTPCKSNGIKAKKPKFLSLRLQFPADENKQIKRSRMRHGTSAAAAAAAAVDQSPLQRENQVEERESNDHENVAFYFSSTDGGATTLTGLLDASTVAESNSSHTNNNSSRLGNLPPPSPASLSQAYGEERAALVRNALRSRDRDSSEDKWVCYSEVVKEEEVTSSALDPPRREEIRRVSLKLDYEEIMNAWSNKGSFYIDAADNSQTVPDINHHFFSQEQSNHGSNFGCNVGSWTVPEMVVDYENVEKRMGTNGDRELKKGQREASVLRYKEKRQNRLFSRKIRYQVRKLNAEKRPRIKGRFVKRS